MDLNSNILHRLEEEDFLLGLEFVFGELKRISDEYGLDNRHLQLLTALYYNDRSSIRKLEEDADVSYNAISKRLHALADKGYVDKYVPTKQDTKVLRQMTNSKNATAPSLWSLTTKGRNVIREMLENIDAKTRKKYERKEKFVIDESPLDFLNEI